jgi:H+-transporting ATPase
MRRRTLSRDESTPLLTMEQTPPTKEKLDVQSEDAVVIPVDDASADDLDAPLTPSRIKKLLEGLSSEKAAQRLERYGPNSITEREVKWYEVLRRQFTSSMALMIEAAAILAAALQEWAEFGCIAALLAINACIGFFEEWTAIQKVAAIRSKLAPTCAVRRDGKFERRPAAELVRGDLILLRGGDAVPADVDVIDGDTLQLDTAALTGEPFPRACPSSSGDRRALAGCVVVKGHAYAVVRLTGASTTHGEATLLVSSSTKPTVSVRDAAREMTLRRGRVDAVDVAA